VSIYNKIIEAIAESTKKQNPANSGIDILPLIASSWGEIALFKMEPILATVTLSL
jgi:hypothetical protein